MSKTQIDISELSPEFANTAKIIFNQVREIQDLTNIETKRAITTILSVYDNYKFPNSNDEDIRLRTINYIKNIKIVLQKTTIGNDLDSWLILLMAAINNNEITNQQTSICDEQFYDFYKIILEATIREYERSLVAENSGHLVSAVREEINKLCNLNSVINPEIINQFLKYKNRTISNLVSLAQQQKKNKFIFLSLQHLSRIKFIERQRNEFLVKKILGSVIELLNIKNNSLARFFPDAFKTIVSNSVRQFTLLSTKKRKAKKEAKKIIAHKKRKDNVEFLYNVIHSHNPINSNKIPNFIANNIDFIKEAQRLKNLGLSKYNASSEAQEKISHTKKEATRTNKNLETLGR